MVKIDLHERTEGLMRFPELGDQIHRSLEAQELEKQKEAMANPPRLDRMSSSGRCYRDRWATFRGIPMDADKRFDGPILTVFRLGHAIEDEVVDLLTSHLDCKVHSQQLELGEAPHYLGHIDGIIEWKKNPSDLGFTKSLLEIKSAKSSRWELCERVGYRKFSENYYAQVQAYLRYLPDEISTALVVVYDKDTSRLYFELIPEDSEYGDGLWHEHLIVMEETETAPPRPPQATSKSCKFCKWCSRNSWCWNKANHVRFDP